MLPKYLAIVFAIILSVSCAGRVDTPLEISKFILAKNLIIQSGFSSIYFQNNGTIRPNDVNEYEPFCSLTTELTSTSGTPVEIEADAFAITKIDNNSPEGKSFTVSGGQKVGVKYTTQFSLTSEKQPFVHSLVCQRWAVSSSKRYLSVNEIEEIIGKVGKFEQ